MAAGQCPSAESTLVPPSYKTASCCDHVFSLYLKDNQVTLIGRLKSLGRVASLHSLLLPGVTQSADCREVQTQPSFERTDFHFTKSEKKTIFKPLSYTTERVRVFYKDVQRIQENWLRLWSAFLI